jgi:hypothetical protein
MGTAWLAGRLSADELQIEAKLTRQRILARGNPPRFSAILDEAALHRIFGGSQVMAVQLAKILEMSALPNIVVQVIPYGVGAHPAMDSNFTILELPAPTPGVVYVEGLIESVYLERAEDLKRYREIFNRLQSIALSPDGTVDLIADLSRSYRGVDNRTRSPVMLTDQKARGLQWRKAKRSAGDGECVEVALVDGKIVVRDSRDPDGTWQRYPAQSWRDFVSIVKRSCRYGNEINDPAQTLAR